MTSLTLGGRLRGRRRTTGGVRPGRLGLLGPAFVAAVAYVDPGNIATNVSAGARSGYLLVWVVVAANAVAMLVQYLSAKLGLATGRSLPELCREQLPRPVAVGLWLQAEVVAMATDLAEFVGAALGLNLLFGVGLPQAGLVTAVVVLALLHWQSGGARRLQVATAALLGLVGAGFGYDLVAVGGPSGSGVAAGLVPRFAGPDSLTLAVAIVGATVMPHAIYLHSALTRRRPAGRARLLSGLRWDCGLGLGLAGLINIAMLALAAAVFHAAGAGVPDTIQAAHAGLARTVGGGTALAFAVALLASGLSSAGVGTHAGEVVMSGFLRRRVSPFARRAVTMLPALAVLAAGLPVTATLVVSQVLLCFGIPAALVPLILLTRRRDLMAGLVNRRSTTVIASLVSALIIGLDGYLVVGTLTG